MIVTTPYCKFDIADPNEVDFENNYFEQIYHALLSALDPFNPYPHIDFDCFRDRSIGLDIELLAADNGIGIRATEKDRMQKSMLPFMVRYPAFFNFIRNLSVMAPEVIHSAEIAFGANTTRGNFIEIKRVIDKWNYSRWTRDKNLSERQSGVSVLGTVSETLLQTALGSMIDSTNFFKNNQAEVQSYGDFVLMCLPNNLWLSVKSNFARERLLASGFTTDILGVGFFTDDTEFTSGAKLRNFQKVGFLAMYVPDIPITGDQIADNISTFAAIENFYARKEQPLPLNINGRPFIRRLSALHKDLDDLLGQKNIQKRTTIGF